MTLSRRNLLAAWAPVLDALTGDAQAVLLALAVTADHPELLAAAAGRDVADGIDELVSAGLVVAEPDGRVVHLPIPSEGPAAP